MSFMDSELAITDQDSQVDQTPYPHEITSRRDREWHKRSEHYNLMLMGLYTAGGFGHALIFDRLPRYLIFIPFSGFLFSLYHLIFLKLMSEKNLPSHRSKRRCLPALTDAYLVCGIIAAILLMVTQILMLSVIDKRYLVFLTCPVLGTVGAVMILYFGLENKPHDQMDIVNEYKSIIANLFRFSYFYFWVGFTVLSTMIGKDYRNNTSSFPNNHHTIISVSFLIAMVGLFTMAITTFPYRLKRNFMFVFVKGFRIFMMCSLWVVAMILASKFLEKIMVILVLFIELSFEFAAKWCCNLSKTQSTENNLIHKTEAEINTTAQKLVWYCIAYLSMLHLPNSGIAEFSALLPQRWSLFFVLLSIIFCSNRVAFPFVETNSRKIGYKIIQGIIYALQLVLPLVIMLPFIVLCLKSGTASVAIPPSP